MEVSDNTKSENQTEQVPDMEKYKLLEERLAKLEGVTGSEGSEDIAPEEYTNQLKNSDTICEVRTCDLRTFKNRFSPKDGRYAVDVLVSGALVEAEEVEEQNIRRKLSNYGRDKDTSGGSTKRKVGKAEVAAKEANLLANKAIRNAQSKDMWVQRIRIQSPALLAILAKLQGESWTSRQRTYLRPFSTLLYFHERMKSELEELHERWGARLDRTSPGTTLSGDEYEEPVDNCPAALAALRCYITWFDNEIVPDWSRFQRYDHAAAGPCGVRFDDLDYVFRTGDILYRPPESSLTRMHGFREDKRIWRAYYIRIPSVNLKSAAHPRDDHRRYQDAELEESVDAAFTVRAFYLEFNGEEFVTVTKAFHILPYVGSIPVVNLPVYPARFFNDTPALLKTATKIGDSVLHYIDVKHATYNAWTVTRTPSGEPVVDAATGATVKHAEHVNSEVMVDFSEAFQASGAWKPRRRILRWQPAVQEVSSDEFPILVWSNANRDRLLGETSELVPLRTGVSVWQSNHFLDHDKLMKAMSENDNAGRLTTRDYLREEDKMLVTGRVYAYVFTERKFVQVIAEKLRPSSRTSDALNSLQIPYEVKGLIQGVIRGHLLHKGTEKDRGEGAQALDLIQGKGAGLFILLHGVPGVGKTATAEAMAQAHGKPLFKITCGDLGLTPDQVESNLRGIFRLAGLWDCILLLDEVDTFFSQRSKADAAMNKNALVSVFLRVLDYYNGILFLTTNRAGALDEAFKSRIHCKIYYPPLSRNQTLEIWQLNIKRLRRIEREQHKTHGGRLAPLQIPEREILHFAAEQFDRLEQRRRQEASESHRRDGSRTNGQWNGRQIRNAFQVARSLAYSDAHTKVDQMRHSTGEGDGADDVALPTPKLEIRHFQMMCDISDDFDEYMREVYNGQDDADMQREREERADHFVPRRRHSHGGVGKGHQGYPFREDDHDRSGNEAVYHQHGGGFVATWKRQTGQGSSFVNSERPSSPLTASWGQPRPGRTRGLGLDTGGPSLQTQAGGSSSKWAPLRDGGWREAHLQFPDDDEPYKRPSPPNVPSPTFTRDAGRHLTSVHRSADHGAYSMSSSSPPLRFTAPSAARAGGTSMSPDLLLPQPPRLGSGDYLDGLRASTREDMIEARSEQEYVEVRNQHGKRERGGFN